MHRRLSALALVGLTGAMGGAGMAQESNLIRGAAGAWEAWAPRDEVAPRFGSDRRTRRSGAASLRIRCTADQQIGAWRQRCAGVQGGATYRLTGFFRTRGVPSTLESVWVKLGWLDAKGNLLAKDYVSRFTPDGPWARAEGEVPAPADATSVEVELGLQWCVGTVWWDDVRLERCETRAPRRVRAATASFWPPAPTTPEANLAFFAGKVDEAGRAGADIVCLGEGITVVGTGRKYHEVAEPIPGPSTKALGEAARRNRLWIVAGLYERDGGRVYNTAVLIDREGKLAGRYRKTHLPETEMIAGIVPGTDYPVFRTDFGTIGIQICYDSFFPEVARALALNGAEILFTPIWGDGREENTAWDVVARARAIDNAVFFVASMYGPKRSLIIDPGGHILADTKDQEGIVFADLELDQRRQTPWLSVAGLGEWKRLYPKERRPSTYGPLLRPMP